MRGHRTAAHTADTRIEAWAPTAAECIAEAVLGAAESFLDLTGATVVAHHDIRLPSVPPEDRLVAALDEVVYLMDTTGRIPVGVTVRQDAAGPVLRLALADLAALPQTGAVPKAVALHRLVCEPRDGGWACAVTLDV